jgi:GGDEF domain-containing protein
VACYPEDGNTAGEVIRQADASMYMVKRGTRDNVGVAGRGPLDGHAKS